MQQQNKPAQNDKALRGFLPWIVLGIGVLVVLVGIIVSSMLKDKSPPRPVGPAARIPKVNLHYPLQRWWGGGLPERPAKSDSF